MNYMKPKKVILITGASSGIGRDVAKKLLAENHIIYAAARRTHLMDDLKALGAHIIKLDVTNTDSVNEAVTFIIKNEGTIDVLINNAGFATLGAIEDASLESIEYQFNVNIFGIARMLKSVLPHMRKARKGLVINIGSVAGYISPPIMGWYASTKHALKGITDSLRVEVSPLGIDVVLIEPGAIKTGFKDVSEEYLEKDAPSDDYNAMVEGFKRVLNKTYSKAPGTNTTVKAIVDCIHAKNPKIRYRTTTEAKILPILKSLICDRTFDKIFIRQIK